MVESKEELRFSRFNDLLRGKEGEILLAAFECIVEKGINASSTHAIAAKAKLSQGSIHYYFQSKHHLMMRLIEVLFQNSMNNISLVAKSGLSPREKINLIIAAGESFIGERRKEFIVFVAIWSYAISNGGIIREKYMALFSQFRDTITTLLRDVGVKSSDCEYLSLVIVGAIEGFGIQHAIDPDAFDLKRTVSFLKQTLENLY
jgi:AcrR family transcriptional regulator